MSKSPNPSIARPAPEIQVDVRQLEHELHDIEDLRTTEAAERIDQPPTEDEDIKPQYKIYAPLSFPVLVLLIPASILGTLARLGLLALVSYNGESIFPLAYVQGLGCLIMGFGLRLKEPIGQFYGPLYTALTTGFCGSLTTFSSWQVDVFHSWINAAGTPRSGLHTFIDGLGKSIFTLSLSLASVAFGYNIADVLAPHLPTLKSPSKPVRYAWNGIAVCMYAALLPAYFNMSHRFRHHATAALLFAYPGALTRYLISVYLNRRIKALPLGTLMANLFGTALLGIFVVLQSLSGPVSPYACAILQGLGDGYCGCLTTISTFAVELRELKWWKSVRYGIISWGGGQLLLLVIIGPSIWAGHAEKYITCGYVH
ncbi:CRCB-domain-containing protein [Macrolepiota fuliginosa MF-IS2]|uniref:CRCB-domain-containing protein n=1 Tax=Macrolepiota fuliginosa MF-IS2 TaxID=1400762 RepID=A0A9P5XMB1_9AGAR|nr:CRCB-domain-containing protein [Macrolepiota fuliginosa MF-IS2]